MAGLEAAQADNAYNRVRCNNDLAADSTIVFEDVDGTIILPDPDTAVPPGGTLHVFLDDPSAWTRPLQRFSIYAMPLGEPKGNRRRP